MKVALVALLSIGVLCSVGSILVAAPEQGPRPGDISPPNVWVQNRGPDQAIPVALVDGDQPLRVQVLGPAPVGVGATVVTRASRQPWEYMQVRIGAAQDAAAVLNDAGADGWETTGMQFPTTDGTIVVLKRPR